MYKENMKIGKGTNHKEHNPHLQQLERVQRAENKKQEALRNNKWVKLQRERKKKNLQL